MSYPLFATTCTVAHQAPLSLGLSRQEYWSGLPFPSPGNLPSPGTEPRSPTLQADSSLSESSGKPKACQQFHFVYHDPNFTKYESLLNTLEGKKPAFLGPTLEDFSSVGLGWTQASAFPQLLQDSDTYTGIWEPQAWLQFPAKRSVSNVMAWIFIKIVKDRPPSLKMQFFWFLCW